MSTFPMLCCCTMNQDRGGATRHRRMLVAIDASSRSCRSGGERRHMQTRYTIQTSTVTVKHSYSVYEGLKLSTLRDVLPGVPVIESPLFHARIDDLQLTAEERRIAVELHERGYAVIDFPDDELGERI